MHSESPSRLKTVFCAFTGMAISTCGLTVILGAIWKLKELFQNPELLKIYLALVPEEEKVRTLIVGDQSIIIPAVVFHYGAYGIALFILFIGGMLGSSLLKRGVSLLVAA